ncbi:MAG: hypothetical protein HRU77_04015 [Gammaproteobacteria bacterium]|nr:MAG: hypothetical protein HRU77_04015 [Gammaproteobacteria bacterium]
MTIDRTTILSGIKTFTPNLISTLLFESNFEANTTHDNFAANGVQDQMSGTDLTTGFTWPTAQPSFPNGGDGQALNCNWSVIYLGHKFATLSPANVGNYAVVDFPTMTGPDGSTGRALHLNLKDTGQIDHVSHVNQPFGGQLDLMFNRVSDNTNPLPPLLGDVYFSYWCKRPGALSAQIPNVNDSAVQVDFKTGGWYDGTKNQYGGGFRTVLHIVRMQDGSLRWRAIADNGANGGMTTDPSGILPFNAVSPNKIYWYETHKTAPVTLDAWFKVEGYIHMHESKGICLFAIDDQIICHHIGRTKDEFGLPWGRIMPILMYSQGGPCEGWFWNIIIRDYPPSNSVLYAPAAIDLYRLA